MYLVKSLEAEEVSERPEEAAEHATAKLYCNFLCVTDDAVPDHHAALHNLLQNQEILHKFRCLRTNNE